MQQAGADLLGEGWRDRGRKQEDEEGGPVLHPTDISSFLQGLALGPGALMAVMGVAQPPTQLASSGSS